MAQQSAWWPTYQHINLTALELDGDSVVAGTKKDLTDLCRELGIHRAAITPHASRWGRGYVIQGDGDRRANVIRLLKTDHTWADYRLTPPHAGYQPYTQIGDLSKLLDAVAADYNEGTPTKGLADALTGVVSLWLDASRAGRAHIDTAELDKTLAVHLNPLLRAWLTPITADRPTSPYETPHEHRKPIFDLSTGRYLGERHYLDADSPRDHHHEGDRHVG